MHALGGTAPPSPPSPLTRNAPHPPVLRLRGLQVLLWNPDEPGQAGIPLTAHKKQVSSLSWEPLHKCVILCWRPGSVDACADQPVLFV